MSNQPIAGPGGTAATALTPHAVGADRGIAWWGEAWRLFTPAAGVWILILVLLVILNMVLAVVPLIGHVIFQIFSRLLFQANEIHHSEIILVGVEHRRVPEPSDDEQRHHSGLDPQTYGPRPDRSGHRECGV